MRPSLPDPSSPVAPHIVAFVQHKRSLNRQYDVEDKALRLFDRYLNEAGVRTLGEISPAILDAFFLSRPRNRSRSFNHLVGVVSRLFEWMVEHDIIDRSPVTMKPRRRGQARPPCILGVEHGQRLVDMAERFSDRNKAPLRGPTYATIFSLLFGLGLRVGEAARLRWGDVDRNRGILTIRETKFSKSRLVPMGPRLANRLSAFMNMRMKGTPGLAGDAPVFSFTGGRPINPGTISLVFHALAPKLNIPVPPGGTPPHLHDLRHSFAVGRLLRWYRDGGKPADNLMKLSTFMGHVDPVSTAVYLTITTELMDAAASRFQTFAAPISTGGQQ